MASLILCAMCNGRVSTDAASCPHCGTPNFTKYKAFLALDIEEQGRIQYAAEQELERTGYCEDIFLDRHVH